MFAVFFGAGNLVFPPQIGLVSGSSVFPAIIGLTLSGILFPMLAVAAVGNVGTNLEDICRHAHAKLHLAFMAVAILGVVFGTIPRCGGVAYEIGLCGIFPSIQSTAVKWAFLLVFFGISFLLASSKSSVMDNIGKFITPILLICLLIIGRTDHRQSDWQSERRRSRKFLQQCLPDCHQYRRRGNGHPLRRNLHRNAQFKRLQAW